MSTTGHTPTSIRLIFCGSFLAYSAQVLEALHADSSCEIVAVVTTPPAVSARDKSPIKNPVHLMAESFQLTVLTPDELTPDSVSHLPDCDILLTAGYGKLLPNEWLSHPRIAALNAHFSLLPKFRGANPAEWALLLGETETGVTLIEMSPTFDTGHLVAQASIPITATDTRETLYQRLYTLAAEMTPPALSEYVRFRAAQTDNQKTNDSYPNLAGKITYFLPPQVQPPSPTPYAKRLQRADGFIPWQNLSAAMHGKSSAPDALSPTLLSCLKYTQDDLDAVWIARAARALSGFPGLWTLVPTAKGQKRMKVLATNLTSNRHLILTTVQLEGQAPAAWNQVKNSILA